MLVLVAYDLCHFNTGPIQKNSIWGRGGPVKVFFIINIFCHQRISKWAERTSLEKPLEGSNGFSMGFRTSMSKETYIIAICDFPSSGMVWTPWHPLWIRPWYTTIFWGLSLKMLWSEHSSLSLLCACDRQRAAQAHLKICYLHRL